MQKLTKTEIRWIINELENNADDSMKMVSKTDDAFCQEYFRRRAENLYSIAHELRLALVNEDERIAIE